MKNQDVNLSAAHRAVQSATHKAALYHAPATIPPDADPFIRVNAVPIPDTEDAWVIEMETALFRVIIGGVHRKQGKFRFTLLGETQSEGPYESIDLVLLRCTAAYVLNFFRTPRPAGVK